MNNFTYSMPTKLLVGAKSLINNSFLLKEYGEKALIVTGKYSSKVNGSLEDVIESLEKEDIKYTIFDSVEENPSTETVFNAYNENKEKDIDFIVAIGGGSPLDAAKAIGILFKNDIEIEDITKIPNLKSIPIIAIPTTAGTGSEATPYSILTFHDQKLKKNIGQRVFPKLAILDARYMINMPHSVTSSTALDAFTHLTEGYLNTNASILSDTLAEKGLKLFGEILPKLIEREYDINDREKMLLMSTLAGMVISQTGTSLPHAMGYSLTYENGLPHGTANIILYPGYLSIFKDKTKLKKLLSLIQVSSIDELAEKINKILDFEINLSKEEIERYTDIVFDNKGKLKNHPEVVTRDDIKHIYETMLTK